MNAADRQERAALLRARGGKRAAAFWLLRKLLRLDIYRFYAVRLQEQPAPEALPADARLLVLSNPAEVAACDSGLIAQLDPHTGSGVLGVVGQRGRVFAVVQEGHVVSQLRIDLGRAVIDTPLALCLTLRERTAFLSFLHTDPRVRQGGWARRLIAHTEAQLAREGLETCTCHVQATNVRSINTFVRAGWKPAAWLLASSGGRLLGIRQTRHSPVVAADPVPARRSR